MKRAVLKNKNITPELSTAKNKSLLLLGKKIFESFISVLPVVIIVLIIYFTPLVDISAKTLGVFLVSSLFLIIGIGLFNMGADIAMTPMGGYVGSGLTKSGNLKLLLIVCFIMGVLVTVAEPDLSVLANQVSTVLNSTVLIVTVGIGVGFLLLVSILKIIAKVKLFSLLLFLYMVLFALMAILVENGKGSFLPLIFDSGGVTTGPVTVVFIMALGVGIATTIGGKDASENSFGIVALCSIGPMIAVAILCLTTNGELSYALSDYSHEVDFQYFGSVLLSTMNEVSRAILLIGVFFILLQIFVLKLPKRKLIQIAIGITYTFIGLVIFLTAANIGFLPVGFRLGETLAENKVALIIFAFVIGMVVVLAEPAIKALNKQVEEVTLGRVTKRAMMIALSVGVGVAIGLSVIRIIFKFSILYYIVPGYCLSFVLSFFVPKIYTAIAFDSGGVASGPLSSAFILPFAIGACATLNGVDAILDFAFGIVAMIAMTPLITIQLLGFRSIMTNKYREKETMKRIINADDEQIISFM